MKKILELINQGKKEEALTLSKQSLKGNEPYVYYNHAIIAYELGDIKEAAETLKHVKTLLPHCPIIRRILGDFLLSLGHYKEGLAEMEWRFTFPTPESPRFGVPLWGEVLPRIRQCYKKPYWNGQPSNKTVLVFNEGGFGDMIQNIRYLPLLKKKVGKVIIETKPELYKLIKNSFDEEVISSANRVNDFVATFMNKNSVSDLPEHDYVISCNSFPHFFDSELKNTPMEMPYLKPTGKKKLESDRLKIGICWAGNSKEETDRLRSCPLKHFKHLNEFHLFSLQKGNMERRWPSGNQFVPVNLVEGANVPLTELPLEDFNDTAEYIEALDLVISVDTAVAHLAGALNKKCFLIASKEKHEWRWDHTWYQSVTVLRQETLGDWDELLKRCVKLTTEEIIVS